MNTHVSRRRFLQASASLGAFSVIVSKTPSLLASDTLMGGSMPPVLKVDANGYAVLCVPVPDMGQGMLTGAAQLVAEELDIALEHVRVELMSFVGSINDEAKPSSASFIKVLVAAWPWQKCGCPSGKRRPMPVPC
ncbi:molybdopterin cofactor-binding domain-containing protein [Kordiimonas gwangyangensis]|uniref:molybdopterin cofactor-binding domain-containing protein n=1 Tax=Kordiimonas gwangyangensis TaxID=288022 RepID=UPI000470ADF0|nr:molybdopterin cofactor-binding domain-containing protein [Kordiimonas gwangyangensis]